MKKINFALGLSAAVITLSAGFVSCKKTPNTVAENLPDPTLPEMTYDYASKHGVNSDLATLGRVLFYDRNLSSNKSTSCGSCHKQEFAFADNVRFNVGATGILLNRNSPSIQGIKGFFTQLSFPQTPNVNSDDRKLPEATGVSTMPDRDNQVPVLLFWDGRQTSVPDMVLNPVLNHNEMNMPDFPTLMNRLSGLSYYPALFKNAFGDEAISKERIAYALEGFLACLNTTAQNSAGFFNGDGPIFAMEGNGSMPHPGMGMPQSEIDDANLTPLEKQGKFLFHNKYNCAQCHDPSNSGEYGSVSSPTQMFNIGLDEVYSDNGLGALTGKAGDKGLFKVPTLKNISVTAPYMHDGRFANLGEVLDHYSHEIKANGNLSPKFLNADGTPKKLDIKPAEKVALIAFLNTLKDKDFLESPMYSDPFKK